MRTVEMHEAKTHLSKLVEEAAGGEPFVIARAGKPMVKVVALEPEPEVAKVPQRLGFMKGMGKVPADFDTMYADEIVRMFEGEGSDEYGRSLETDAELGSDDAALKRIRSEDAKA